MVPVFIGGPQKPCSKTMKCMVLAAAVALPCSVAPADRAERLGVPDWLRRNCSSLWPRWFPPRGYATDGIACLFGIGRAMG